MSEVVCSPSNVWILIKVSLACLAHIWAKKYLDGASPCVSHRIRLLVLQLAAWWCSWRLTSCSKEDSWETWSNKGEIAAFCRAIYSCAMRSSSGVVYCCLFFFSGHKLSNPFPCKVPKNFGILIWLRLTPLLLDLTFEMLVFQVSCIHFKIHPFPNSVFCPYLHQLNRSDDTNMVG